MCGRYSLDATPDEVRALFAYEEVPNFPPRYNIAPTQPVAIVRQDHGGHRHFGLLRWGLVPAWVKDPASFTLLINARSETAVEKPSFRTAMKHGRCIFPMSGYYEWRRTAEGRQPFFIHRADRGVMAVAGLWETWCDPDGGDMDTGAILTTPANRTLAQVHDRMPAVLRPEEFGIWLDTGKVMARDARRLLRPADDDMLVATPVSSRVNSVANDDPGLIEEVPEAVAEARPKAPETARGGLRSGGGSSGGAPDDQLTLF